MSREYHHRLESAGQRHLVLCSGFGDHITLLFVYELWKAGGENSRLVMVLVVVCCVAIDAIVGG